MLLNYHGIFFFVSLLLGATLTAADDKDSEYRVQLLLIKKDQRKNVKRLDELLASIDKVDRKPDEEPTHERLLLPQRTERFGDFFTVANITDSSKDALLKDYADILSGAGDYEAMRARLFAIFASGDANNDPDLITDKNHNQRSERLMLVRPPPKLQEEDKDVDLDPKNYYYRKDGGKGVSICMIDTGINVDHREFDHVKGQRRLNYTRAGPVVLIEADKRLDSDNQHRFGHGTSVAGLLVGELTGIAKGADLFVVGALDKDGTTSDAIYLDALVRVYEEITANRKDKLNIINLSMSAGYFEHDDPISRGIQAAMKEVWQEFQKLDNVLITAASGVGEWGEDTPFSWPVIEGIESTSKNMIIVGGVDEDGIGIYQNHERIKIHAPAYRVKIASNIGYQLSTGTSFASAFVAGVLANYGSRYPEKTAAELKKMLEENAYPRIKGGPAVVWTGEKLRARQIGDNVEDVDCLRRRGVNGTQLDCEPSHTANKSRRPTPTNKISSGITPTNNRALRPAPTRNESPRPILAGPRFSDTVLATNGHSPPRPAPTPARNRHVSDDEETFTSSADFTDDEDALLNPSDVSDDEDPLLTPPGSDNGDDMWEWDDNGVGSAAGSDGDEEYVVPLTRVQDIRPNPTVRWTTYPPGVSVITKAYLKVQVAAATTTTAYVGPVMEDPQPVPSGKKSNRPQYDRPEYNRPKSARPEYNRPKSTRPQSTGKAANGRPFNPVKGFDDDDSIGGVGSFVVDDTDPIGEAGPQLTFYKPSLAKTRAQSTPLKSGQPRTTRTTPLKSSQFEATSRAGTQLRSGQPKGTPTTTRMRSVESEAMPALVTQLRNIQVEPPRTITRSSRSGQSKATRAEESAPYAASITNRYDEEVSLYDSVPDDLLDDPGPKSRPRPTTPPVPGKLKVRRLQPSSFEATRARPTTAPSLDTHVAAKTTDENLEPTLVNAFGGGENGDIEGDIKSTIRSKVFPRSVIDDTDAGIDKPRRPRFSSIQKQRSIKTTRFSFVADETPLIGNNLASPFTLLDPQTTTAVPTIPTPIAREYPEVLTCRNIDSHNQTYVDRNSAAEFVVHFCDLLDKEPSSSKTFSKHSLEDDHIIVNDYDLSINISPNQVRLTVTWPTDNMKPDKDACIRNLRDRLLDMCDIPNNRNPLNMKAGGQASSQGVYYSIDPMNIRAPLGTSHYFKCRRIRRNIANEWIYKVWGYGWGAPNEKAAIAKYVIGERNCASHGWIDNGFRREDIQIKYFKDGIYDFVIRFGISQPSADNSSCADSVGEMPGIGRAGTVQRCKAPLEWEEDQTLDQLV
ncbi:hypothetical protein DRE_03491 [Drechslerella stenobrocha 248]|uniref:Peptidase S8/S53 domain-containing protein n=1 Tax=Drechslerella stenobrocha 248 TaxID=1043628 RepID=W7I3Z2_9PEZI|nr:hypothetical protein DRE_03491 [Drechslerella stenobrocha 248]